MRRKTIAGLVVLLLLTITGWAASTAVRRKPPRSEEPFALPSLRVQLALLGYDNETISKLAGASNVTLVDVTFSGPILHITAGSLKRAVVIHDAAHEATIRFHPVDTSKITETFGAVSCTEQNGCTVPLTGLALKVVDSVTNQNAVNKLDVEKMEFRARVPRIGRFFNAGVPTEADLHPDVWMDGPPDVAKPDRRVAAYFDINSGTFLSTRPSRCLGRFVTEPAEQPRDFAQSATATFAFANPAKLVIGKKNQEGRETWLEVLLAGSHPEIEIANRDTSHGYESHFDLFNQLKNPKITLNVPSVESPGCKADRDEVPGCGNSSWP